jgi:hypothetical protein
VKKEERDVADTGKDTDKDEEDTAKDEASAVHEEDSHQNQLRSVRNTTWRF